MRRSKNHIAAPHRRVDLLHHEQDFQAALLGSLGFSTKAIMAKTDLSAGQISYRLRLGQVSRADYRNGESLIAKRILKSHMEVAEPVLLKQLRTVLKEVGEH